MCLVWPTRWKSSSKGHPLTLPFGPRHEWRGAVRPNMKTFTRQLFHFSKTSAYPFVRCKGSDMMLLTRWLGHILAHGVVFEGDLLRSGRKLIDVFSARVTSCHCCKPLVQHRCTAFFPSPPFLWVCGWNQMFSSSMAESCLKFCEAYNRLWPRVAISFDFADSTLNLRCMVFRTFTLTFGTTHVTFSTRLATHVKRMRNFVGKVARLARSVHAATTTARVIDRILIKCHFELEEPTL